MKFNINLTSNFQERHIGPDEGQVSSMLNTVGAASMDQLIRQAIPDNIRVKDFDDLPEAQREDEFIRSVRSLADKNKKFKSFIGLGYYNTNTPPVIQRNILENPGWYTAYTPYQAEIAQGRLEALVNFQTMVIDLTGMEIANASLLDEGTAAAEAMLMLHALQSRKKKGDSFFVSKHCFPQTIEVLRTRAEPVGINLIIDDEENVDLNDEGIFGVLLQYPNQKGSIKDYTEFIEQAHQNNIMTVVAADILSLTVLKSPGSMGADVVVGSTQRFGVPMGYGGPHAAYFATRDAFKRSVPGRIIGLSVDTEGRQAYRMALQTREQHIRREKATSNICTAQVLLAVMAGSYAVYHGPEGLRGIGERVHGLTTVLNNLLEQAGYTQKNEYFFDTLKIAVGGKKEEEEIRKAAEAFYMNFRYFGDGHVGISLDETTETDDVLTILKIFAGKEKGENFEHIIGQYRKNKVEAVIPDHLLREVDYLSHPVFNSYHSEHEMLRYLKRLENRDLSLVHSMISLGSCTMKLNATSEMVPITWPEFSEIHPYVPAEQAEGYAELFDDLGDQLCYITGLPGISFQPNSGAQGEYTGLLAIRAYHVDNGERERDVVIIPSSAHGTNPASAKMAGMKVEVCKCDDEGNIDLSDLKARIEKYDNRVAGLMVTYPSTHGVFEEHIKEVCAMVHEAGGQIYMDGANLNAQLGLTTPALIGADVCHLNLHKTFCIPHGGGGPGMGPICVAEHLKPYLPGHIYNNTNTTEKGITAVSSAAWGSAGILPISYGFIKMMGAEGLKRASEVAILNANYIMQRLKEHYKILYTGANGRSGHEFIIDCRDFKQSSGVDVEDIAKRLIDYGYHAPTVSFPVPGTMMIEPTESEEKGELDRFCEALINIKAEIDEVERGEADQESNVLKNAPHTSDFLLKYQDKLPYSSEKAAFPLEWVRERKFWPAVGRVDNAYGDRNLVCSCPPIESYMEEETV